MPQDNPMNVGLCKWPQMVVTGAPLSVERAKEIIRRTDSFFAHGYGGNARDWDTEVKQKVRMPDSDKTDINNREGWRKVWDDLDVWRQKWGIISTEYVHNSWISCAFIGGPHGWCHPDGVIGFVDNVGKWPDAQDVFKDWQTIAKEFPFLDLAVTLMSGESCEEDTHPVVSMLVKDGVATALRPDPKIHEPHKEATRRAGSAKEASSEFIASFGMPARHREVGIPPSWIDEWSKLAETLFPGVSERV